MLLSNGDNEKMAKGLDIGTMNIICSELEGEREVFTQQRNAFLELDSSDLTKSMLDSAEVFYVEKDGLFYLLGEDALKFSNIFGKEVRRPMRHGIISPKEKDAIPMIKLILKWVLRNSSEHLNEILCISSPADPIDLGMNTLYRRKITEVLARGMAYKAHLIDESLALIYSELSDHEFTGLGISFGAGLTNVTLAYLATPLISFSIGRGGDWIDEQVSITTGLPKENVCAKKEGGFTIDPDAEFDRVEGALSIYYDALMTYVIENLKRELAEITQPKMEFPVVLAGGTTLPDGFLRWFGPKLRAAQLQVEISEIRRAKDPLHSVARGCLIAGRAQEEAEK